MENLPPEVLIYIQTVKNFFSKNEGTREYFLSQIDEDVFFKFLGDISKKNFEDNGEVMLTEVQFELLRKTLIALKISEMDESELPIEMSFDYELETIIYIDDRGYEKITSK
jgi:hypothetical protein